MFRYGLVLTLVAFASAKVEVLNINEDVDNSLDYENRKSMSIYPLEEGQFGPQVYHSDGFLMWDSLVRTGDNVVYILDKEKKVFRFEYNIGAKVLLASFPQMEVLGKNLTTTFRAYNNSVHCKYSVEFKDNRRCAFTLEDLSLEKLDGLEFSSTEEEFEDEEVAAYFRDVVFPGIKTYMKTKVAAMYEMVMSNTCDQPGGIFQNSHPRKFLNKFKAYGL